MSVELLASVVPWRTFRWFKGQKHYSGIYWSATTNDHVIYESRLELTRPLIADFDPSVRHIVAQPFLLKAALEGKVRKHIPDYLLITGQGPVVVDVKPLRRVSKPEVAFTFDWTRKSVESHGWQYEVWSEPPPAELENIRFLAGYRRSWLSVPISWTSFVAPISTVSRWGRSRAGFRGTQSRKCILLYIICSGPTSSSWISIARSARPGCAGGRHERRWREGRGRYAVPLRRRDCRGGADGCDHGGQ